MRSSQPCPCSSSLKTLHRKQSGFSDRISLKISNIEKQSNTSTDAYFKTCKYQFQYGERANLPSIITKTARTVEHGCTIKQCHVTKLGGLISFHEYGLNMEFVQYSIFHPNHKTYTMLPSNSKDKSPVRFGSPTAAHQSRNFSFFTDTKELNQLTDAISRKMTPFFKVQFNTFFLIPYLFAICNDTMSK
jgi:hypothetical protein